MDDPEIEALLRQYRPAAPPSELGDRIGRLPSHQVIQSPDSGRTWPWAVAAAALLAIYLGLDATARRANVGQPDGPDPQRVQAVADALGPTAGNRTVAEWIVRQEMRADREAPVAQPTFQEFDRR
jgi:hypothetical protein